MIDGSRSLSRLRRGALVLCLTGLACGEAAAPAAVPEEFDDPFADEPVVAAKAVPGDRSAEAGGAAGSVNAEASAGTVGAAEGAGVVEGASAGVVEGASAGAAEGAGAGAVAGATAGVVEGASAVGTGAKAEVAGAGASVAASEGKKGAKKPVGPKPDAPAPVPADSPPVAPEPAPAPAPEPAPAPAPAPAPVQPAPPVVPPQQRFVGTFKFVGGDAQRQNLETAIEAAAMELNALIRGIGRKRLRDANPIRDQVTIAVDGDKVSMTSVVGRTLVHRLDGPAVPWTSDSGKAVQVSVSLVKGRLVQTYTADDGGRRNTWTLDESGDKLTLSVTVTSDRLTNPLKYALSYRRN